MLIVIEFVDHLFGVKNQVAIGVEFCRAIGEGEMGETLFRVRLSLGAHQNAVLVLFRLIECLGRL